MISLRKILLRLIVGWWMVPATWVIVFPLMRLMSETNKEAINDCIDLSKAYWNGFSCRSSLRD